VDADTDTLKQKYRIGSLKQIWKFVGFLRDVE
jgi:hypothetical protein